MAGSDRSTRSTSTSTILGAEALGLGSEGRHELRALDAVGETGVVLDVARQHQLATGGGAGEDDRLEVRPRGVDRGGQAGRPGADDHELGLRPPFAVGGRPGPAGCGGDVRGEGDREPPERGAGGGRRHGGIGGEIDGEPAERGRAGRRAVIGTIVPRNCDTPGEYVPSPWGGSARITGHAGRSGRSARGAPASRSARRRGR